MIKGTICNTQLPNLANYNDKISLSIILFILCNFLEEKLIIRVLNKEFKQNTEIL